MKLKTALKSAASIAEQMKGSGGLIATPGCTHKYFKARKIWLFGSASKDKALPNDVDILVEGETVGERSKKVRGTYRKDKRNIISGVQFMTSSQSEAMKSIKRRRPNVNVHWAEYVTVPIDKKIMLYPRNDLTPEMIKSIEDSVDQYAETPRIPRNSW